MPNQSGPISFHLDLFSCQSDSIKTEQKIHEFLVEFGKMVGSKPYGDSLILYQERADSPRGYFALQLFQTCFLSAHFESEERIVHIDIFSFFPLAEDKITQFCKHFFQALEVKISPLARSLPKELEPRE